MIFYLIKSATVWDFLRQCSSVCHWKQKSGYDISEKLVKDRWHGFTQHHTCSPQVQHDTKQTWTPLDKTECITAHLEQLTRNITANTSIYHFLQPCQMGEHLSSSLKSHPSFCANSWAVSSFILWSDADFLQHIVYCHLHPNNYPIRTTGTVSQAGLITLGRTQLWI